MLLSRARAFFDVVEAPLADAATVRRTLAEHGRTAPTFALATGDRLAYLTLKRDVQLDGIPSLQGPAVLQP